MPQVHSFKCGTGKGVQEIFVDRLQKMTTSLNGLLTQNVKKMSILSKSNCIFFYCLSSIHPYFSIIILYPYIQCVPGLPHCMFYIHWTRLIITLTRVCHMCFWCLDLKSDSRLLSSECVEQIPHFHPYLRYSAFMFSDCMEMSFKPQIGFTFQSQDLEDSGKKGWLTD